MKKYLSKKLWKSSLDLVVVLKRLGTTYKEARRNNLTREFMLGRDQETQPSNPLLGVKFISLSNGIEFIGEVSCIIDGVAIVENPMIIFRDKTSPTKFEFKKFNSINPFVRDEILVSVSVVSFSFKPSDILLKNYMAARSGLVTASSFTNQTQGN
jgi:hypothetical protein